MHSINKQYISRAHDGMPDYVKDREGRIFEAIDYNTKGWVIGKNAGWLKLSDLEPSTKDKYDKQRKEYE
jgi:hypothetical protein